MAKLKEKLELEKLAEAKEKERQESLKQLALVASTFANNELESKKQTLNEYLILTANLKNENADFREKLAAQQKESFQVTEFLRKEIEKKQEHVELLLHKFEETRQELALEAKNKEDALKNEITSQAVTLARQINHILELQNELDLIKEFKQQKIELESNFQSLKDTMKLTKEKHDQEFSRVRYECLEVKANLKNEEILLKQRFAQDVEKKSI